MSDSDTDDGELKNNDNVVITPNKNTNVISTNEETYVANMNIVNSSLTDLHNAPAIGNPSTFIMCEAIKNGMETFAIQQASIMRDSMNTMFSMFSANVNNVNNVNLEANRSPKRDEAYTRARTLNKVAHDGSSGSSNNKIFDDNLQGDCSPKRDTPNKRARTLNKVAHGGSSGPSTPLKTNKKVKLSSHAAANSICTSPLQAQ